jgi:hypothetical protein
VSGDARAAPGWCHGYRARVISPVNVLLLELLLLLLLLLLPEAYHSVT